MKIVIILFIAAASEIILPQTENTFSLTVFPIYESWNIFNNPDFSEFTTIVSLNYLPERNTNISAASRYASVSGDIKKLKGFSDMQLFGSHRFQEYNLTLNAGLNIPSGKTKLDQDEFFTSRLISQNLFNLNTSNFGQGLNAFLGATYTIPLSDVFVIGAGVSYQIKTEYQPTSLIDQKYQPSNEISFTTGFDVKLSESSVFTADVTGIFYGNDKVDGEEIFSAGNRFVFNSIYKQYFGFDLFSVVILYRYIGAGEYELNNSLVESEKINPNQFLTGLSYNHRVSPVFSLKYGFAFNIYEKTAVLLSGYNLFELSLAPEFKISSSVSIPAILRYSHGSANDKPDLNSYEVGAGIKISL